MVFKQIQHGVDYISDSWHETSTEAESAEFEASKANDPVNHPSHYTSRVPGIECIDVVENFNFNRGGAIKYIWRAGLKDPSKELEDLRKARWLLDREISRLEKGESK